MTHKHQHHWLAQGVAVIAGAATTAQSRVNGELATRVGSGWEAALISFTTGLILLSLYACVAPNVRRGLKQVLSAVSTGGLKWWQVIGGSIGACFVATQSIVVPLMGVAIFTVATVGATTAASILVDRFGIGPQGHIHPTRHRIVAGIIAVIAIAVSVSDRFGTATFAFWGVVASLVVGAGVAFQHALNGHVSRVAQHPVTAAWWNFIVGTTVLVVLFAVQLVSGNASLRTPPTDSWWLYLGGIFGLSFIIVAARIIHVLGSLRFALGSVTGQLTGAVLFDVFAPTAGTNLSNNLLAGLALTGVAVITANQKPGRTRQLAQ